MFFVRKIGKVVRGTASLPQILAASVLGGMLGFVPGFFLPGDLGGGFMQAPGLILAIFALVLVLDANLAVFGLVTVGAKLLSFLLLPISFGIGRFLLEGPTEGLFRMLVNAPVTAFFGLERYATTGGVVLGLVIGLTTGLVLWKALHALRLKMANVEEGSERYQKLASKRSVKVLTWVFVGGGKGKRTWREIAEKDRKGKGVRLVGLAVVAVLLVGLWFVQSSLGGAWLQAQARAGLERWNGATVDLAGATLDLAEARIGFDGLAMADAEDLHNDVFRARTMELDVSTGDLLAGRFVIDRLASGEAKSGVIRVAPGVRIAPEPTPPPEPPGPGKTIDDYVQEAEVWKQRLEKVAGWIEKFGGDGEELGAETAEQRDERVAHEEEVLGLVNVIATHLFDRTPAVTVHELAIEDLRFAGAEDSPFDLRGTNLSSDPALASEPAVLSLTSRSEAFGVELRYDPKDPGAVAVSFHLNGLAIDALAAGLKDSPVHGGTVDLKLEGKLALGRDGGPWIDLPLLATLRGTTIAVGGEEARLEELPLVLGLSGPLRGPKVSVDANALSDALVAAGRQELADQVRARADALLGGEVPGVGDAVGGLVEGTKTPEQLLEEAQKKAEEEARKKAEEEMKKRLPGGIGDLFKKK